MTHNKTNVCELNNDQQFIMYRGYKIAINCEAVEITNERFTLLSVCHEHASPGAANPTNASLAPHVWGDWYLPTQGIASC